ncbi:MAG: hypothetical protein ACRCVN_05135 [Spirochaetia bacterium]
MFNSLERINAPSHVIPFLGYDFDLGYLPLAQTIPLIEGYQDLQKNSHLSPAKILMKKIGIVAKFCQFMHPIIGEKTLLKSCTLSELDAFLKQIITKVNTEIDIVHQLYPPVKNENVSKKKARNFLKSWISFV